MRGSVASQDSAEPGGPVFSQQIVDRGGGIIIILPPVELCYRVSRDKGTFM